eukprot:CAMPEP_0205822068 /NCGR_PEP_ID=MMETSP0206-20130828/10840_1 /ASSEMBLY_ACC=CAM_ASM_000279 /TAXON_ID=36767 /ORGANISM="Euplotes focardii, Strain TN1" /LENGTH=220 /DNA_ID=CAMNT_0053118021 /DNA_START=1 /DNA_END=663 /DNA_ORIENTATION=+
MESSAFQSGTWYEGPASDTAVNEPHGRPILCMDVLGSKVVTGSSDHGLREYNIGTCRQIRQLYSKRYGHGEWVTSCAYASDGRVLSGGMDSKLCSWDKKVVRCDDLTGHKGSISKVKVDAAGVGISGSYDGSLLVWDLSTKECLQGLFKGHKDAITTFEWSNSLMVSGARNGSIAIWDINVGKPVKKAQTHEGAVAKIAFFSDGEDTNLIITAGINDGVV